MSTPVRVARRRPTAGTEAGDAEPSLLEELMALGGGGGAGSGPAPPPAPAGVAAPSRLTALPGLRTGHTASVAHDRDLADRLRDELEGAPGITEKAMFGGLAFLVDGHLAVAASNAGGLLLRADPARTEDLLEHDEVERFVMNGRELGGWLHVDIAADVTAAELRQWIDLGVGYARSL